MRIIIIFVLAVFSMPGLSAQPDPGNIDFLGQFDPPGMPVKSGVQYNDVWGYANASGEFAILGNVDSIMILNVTNPGNISVVLAKEGTQSAVWRDFKTYVTSSGQMYIFAVCDGCSEGMNVFSVNGATATWEYRTTEFFTKAHNIFIDGDFLYAAGTNVDDLVIIDISDPLNPDEEAVVDFGSGFYIHDLYVKNKIAYCSHGNTGLYVWDLNNPLAPAELGSFQNPGNYNHSSWVTDDDAYLYFAEEVPTGLPMEVISLENLGGGIESLESVHVIPPSGLEANGNPTAHNPFIVDDLLVVSYYEDGIKIYDISNPELPVLTGQYDTYGSNNGGYSGYNGCWGTYPFLPSGNILASDMTFGLHVLKYNPCTDVDGDGYCASEDCDDNDPNINPGMAESCDGIDNNCSGFQDDGINCLKVKAILGGAYDKPDNLMIDDLRDLDFLPLGEPYTAMGYNFVGGGGESINPGTLSVTGLRAIVDWVIVELRDKSNASSVLYSRAAILLRNGNIVELDGNGMLDLTAVPFDDYFLAIKHRNHLGAMTSTAMNLSQGVELDFTNGSFTTYGSNAQVEIENNVFALWPGDANGDGKISYNNSSNDKNEILGEVGLFSPNNSLTGYMMTDCNLDSKTKYNGGSNDKNVILSTVGLFSPNNSITEQIPN